MRTNTQDILREDMEPEEYTGKFKDYSLRFEFDRWDSFDPENDAIYVEISTKDGNKYHIDFITLKFIGWVFDKNKRTGECQDGTYFCMPQNMVIVRNLEKDTIRRTIDDLIENLEVHHYLERIESS